MAQEDVMSDDLPFDQDEANERWRQARADARRIRVEELKKHNELFLVQSVQNNVKSLEELLNDAHAAGFEYVESIVISQVTLIVILRKIDTASRYTVAVWDEDFEAPIGCSPLPRTPREDDISG
jgi:hypothetical protein